MTRRKIGGDNSPPTPHPSEDWDAEADGMPFYIHVPVRRTIMVEQWGMGCPACGDRLSRCPCSKKSICGNLTTKPALFRATHFFKKE